MQFFANGLIFSVANATAAFVQNARLSHVPLQVGVGFIEQMSALAMGLPSVSRLNRIPAQRVDSHAGDFQVCGINTAPVSAEMVDDHPGRNQAVDHLISKSVGSNTPPTVIGTATNKEVAVTVSIKPTSPKPAIALISVDVLFKAVAVWKQFYGHQLETTSSLTGVYDSA